MARVGILGPDGRGRFAPFQSVPQEPDPGDPDPDPTDPPDPDPGNPDPTTPAVITHGRQVTTGNTGYAGLGYTAGQLQASSAITTTADGQVIQLKSTSKITINHNNVTVRACEINAPIGSHCITLKQGVYGARIEFCRIHQSLTQGGNMNGVSGIYDVPAGRAQNIIHRCHITHVSDGAKLSGGWVYQQNYWNPTTQYGSTHNDGVQSQKSTGAFNPSVIVRDNKFIGGPNFGNALVFVTGESGNQYNVDIRRNYLQASDKTMCVAIHGQDNIGQWLGDITIEDNDCVVGYNNGPEGFFSLIDVPTSQVIRINNRRVDMSGNVLGPVN